VIQGISHTLSVSLRKYITLSRMITALEPISIHESAIISELAALLRFHKFRRH
jgi:hypothetical protein